jgi:glycosyltransferase involved in cell wall biosynthesis
LFVSFFYPPFNSVGGLRVSKITSHLSRLGWDVRVITVDRDDVPADQAVEIPADQVLRAHNFDVNSLPKLLLGRERIKRRGYEVGDRARPLIKLGLAYRALTNFPDGQIGWYRSAVSHGKRLLRDWTPDVIVSSALPGTAHLVARALARRAQIPWVAEYRDPWTGDRSNRRPPPLRQAEHALETAVTRHAAALITVSDAWAADLGRRFPKVPVYVVPNGFDPADYPDAVPPSTGPLEVVYTGRLYGRQSIEPLLQAARSVSASGAAIRVRLFGRYLADARAMLDEDRTLASVVEVAGPISHLDALAAQRGAHVLALVLANDDDVGWRPAKLYEYLGARRPILILGGSPLHEARRVVLDCRAGVVADDTAEVAAHLLRWQAQLGSSGEVAYHGDWAEVDKFDRARLAEQYAAILASIARSTIPSAP